MLLHTKPTGLAFPLLAATAVVGNRHSTTLVHAVDLWPGPGGEGNCQIVVYTLRIIQLLINPFCAFSCVLIRIMAVPEALVLRSTNLLIPRRQHFHFLPSVSLPSSCHRASNMQRQRAEVCRLQHHPAVIFSPDRWFTLQNTTLRERDPESWYYRLFR